MTRLQATNSLGYGVQWLTKDGWKFWEDTVYDNLHDALGRRALVNILYGDVVETRVYEVLDMEINDDPKV